MYQFRTFPFAGRHHKMTPAGRQEIPLRVPDDLPRMIHTDRPIIPCPSSFRAENPCISSSPIPSSTGLGMFGFKRSTGAQEQLTRLRAQELSTCFELSDKNETTLNRNPNFLIEQSTAATRRAPNLVEAMNARQAAAVYANQRKTPNLVSSSASTSDGNRMCIYKPGSIKTIQETSFRCAPVKQIQQGQVNKKIVTTKTHKSNGKSLEITIPTSPGSTTSTVAETPSPIGYQSASGKFYVLPNIC
jgi:hypothetical protein